MLLLLQNETKLLVYFFLTFVTSPIAVFAFFALQMIVFAIVYYLSLQSFIYHRSGHIEDWMYGACSLSSLVHGVDGWVEVNSSRAQLLFTHHHIQHSLGN